MYRIKIFSLIQRNISRKLIKTKKFSNLISIPQYNFSNNDNKNKGFENFKRDKKKSNLDSKKEDINSKKEDLEENKEDLNTKNDPKKQEIPPQNIGIDQENDKNNSKNKNNSDNDKEEESNQKKSDKNEKPLPISDQIKEYLTKKQSQLTSIYNTISNFFKNGYKFKLLDKEFHYKPFHFYLTLLIYLFFLKLYIDSVNPSNLIKFSEFDEYFSRDQITKITISKKIKQGLQTSHATIYLLTGETKLLNIGNANHFLEYLEKEQISRGRTPEFFLPIDFSIVDDKKKPIKRTEEILHLILSGLLIYMMFKSPNQNNKILKSRVFEKDFNIKVKFNDVAGLDEAKKEIVEFVDFLKNPKRYVEMGARIPRGALLSGPPGTGKTMLAKACAGEAGVPFFYMSGSDFVEMFVGVGATRVRDLFKQAKENSPSIIFIDEIDAVGKKREAKFGGHEERDNTLNQLLVEMDGFGTDGQVVVLAATNKKEVLDSALTRPGRFDRMIEVNLPDLQGRKEIFMVHLQKLKLDPSKTIEEYANRLSTLSPGFSGADIGNLCNEAAIIAARGNKTFVETIDFEVSSERVLAGIEKKSIISEEEKKIVAFHEAGHAVVSWFLEGGAPLLKLTIIPRSKGSLGFAQYLPNESSLESKEELLDRITCIMGGRSSEEIFFKKITTGAYDDIHKAAELAYTIVVKLGMSEKIGNLGYPEEEFVRKHGEEAQTLIDSEIKRIIDKASERAKEIVLKHKDAVERLATKLIEKETLDLNAIIEILGNRPFEAKANFKAYLETKKS